MDAASYPVVCDDADMTRRLFLTMLPVSVVAPAASGQAVCKYCIARGGGAPRAANIEVTVSARSLQPGELVALTVTTAAPVEGLRTRVFGREFPGFREDDTGWRVLVGIDLDVAPGPYVCQIDDGVAHVALGTHPLLVRSHAFPTRTLTVDEGFVNPPASVQDRIAREAGVARPAVEIAHTVASLGRPVPQARARSRQ